MKGRRYFCDWVDEPIEGVAKTKFLLVIIISLIIIPIVGVICYKSVMLRYGNDITHYVKTTYTSLEEIDNKLILSEEDLDVSVIQENISEKTNKSATELYIRYIEFLILLASITAGMIVYLLISGVILIGVFIAKQISKVHKNRDRKRISSISNKK